jgi:hypothetical protein
LYIQLYTQFVSLFEKDDIIAAIKAKPFPVVYRGTSVQEVLQRMETALTKKNDKQLVDRPG